MRLINVIEQPSALLLSPVCASTPSWLPESAPVAALAVERAPMSRDHQVLRVEGVLSAQPAPAQAELVRELATVGGYLSTTGTTSTNGTTGFKGSNGSDLVMKRHTGSLRGAPPRGRPV